LYASLTTRLPPAGRTLLNASDLAISPMMLLELQYLYETGRTTAPGSTVVEDLSHRIGLRLHAEPFQHIITLAVQQMWTRDPFDSIIVGESGVYI
jgi:hypothetical protein